MSARLDENVIVLEGLCRVEDAEPLLGWLQADRSRIVDMTEVEHLHAAVLQVLMALRPTLRGSGKNSFMQDWVTPALMTAGAEDMAPSRG